jgi:hypothetical protein
MDRWFNYAVQETIQRAVEKAAVIREVIKPKEDMVEYQDELKKLQIKHADKDDDGNPVMEEIELENGQKVEKFVIQDIQDRKGKFNVAVDKLLKKYKEAIDGYNEGLKFLDEENKDFEPHWISVDQIPDGITRDEMSLVYLMVAKEKKEDKKKD